MDKIVLHKGMSKDTVGLTFWTGLGKNWHGTTIDLGAKDIIALRNILDRGEIAERSDPEA